LALNHGPKNSQQRGAEFCFHARNSGLECASTARR
jgi:hypothetical protein